MIYHIYDFLIGCEITDISLEIDIDEGAGKEIRELEAFVIHLSNGKKIKISNQLDNPCIHIA